MPPTAGVGTWQLPLVDDETQPVCLRSPVQDQVPVLHTHTQTLKPSPKGAQYLPNSAQ